jgi:GTP-binding protein LepA
MANVLKQRNFCIIAHIDHGKTTLSDRLLEATGVVQKTRDEGQLLDSMDSKGSAASRSRATRHGALSSYRRHGVRAEPDRHARTRGLFLRGFRSLAACEGALLLVDAGQGVEAQTVANATLAVNQNLAIIPVINRWTSPARTSRACATRSRKSFHPGGRRGAGKRQDGHGIGDILSAVVKRVPPPRWADYPQARMLIFDCVYDAFKGVVCYVRVFSGSIRLGDRSR